jgi:hypothetical protein
MTSTIDVRPGDTADPGTVRRPAPWGRGLAIAGLVVGAAGNTAQAVLGQWVDRPDKVADQIVFANEHPALVTVTCVVGTVAVPFMAIGFLAAARFLRGAMRRTGTVAAVLLMLGMWGFMAVQTAELIQLTAMLDPEGAAAATYLDGMDSQVLLGVLFGAPFMIGCFFGVLMLSIALLVKGAGVPRWIPASWLVFILLDFLVGSVGPVDPHWLYLLGAVGLAVHLGRDGGRAWQNA